MVQIVASQLCSLWSKQALWQSAAMKISSVIAKTIYTKNHNKQEL